MSGSHQPTWSLCPGHVDLNDPMFQAILAELALLALIILILAWAMRLIRIRD